MKIVRILTLLLLTMGLFFILLPNVRAFPPFPSSFYGTVKIDGVNVPERTQVSAHINGVQYAVSAYIVYNSDTVYSLNVPGDDPSTPNVIEGGVPGDTIFFHVGDSIADQTALWQGGTNNHLNLTVTPVFGLEVTKTGSGFGSVSSDPPGIDCGSTCSANFLKDSEVILTANAVPGSAFSGWSGDCLGTDTCSISMTAAKSVTATFTQDVYTLTTGVIGSGNITRDNDGPYHYGDVVQLTAVPNPGWAFSTWSGDVVGGVNPAILTIIGNMSVTATFSLNIYQLYMPLMIR